MKIRLHVDRKEVHNSQVRGRSASVSLKSKDDLAFDPLRPYHYVNVEMSIADAERYQLGAEYDVTVLPAKRRQRRPEKK